MRTSTILTVLAFPLTIAFATPARADCAFPAGTPCLDVKNTASTGTAIMGTANAVNSAAIVGYTGGAGSTALTGIARNGGTAISGVSTGGSGAVAVDGSTDGPNSKGVRGTTTSSSGVGVYGTVSAAPSAIAVMGDNTNSLGWAGFFNGRLYSTSGFVSSDERLKKDIADMRYGLDQVLRLRPVTFQWKAEDQRGTQLGLIAQEVDKIVPEIVDHGSGASPMLSVNYTALVPVVIKGMQEQQKIIARMEARIAELERPRRSALASMFSEGQLFGGLALGLVPLGIVLASRRKRRSDDSDQKGD